MKVLSCKMFLLGLSVLNLSNLYAESTTVQQAEMHNFITGDVLAGGGIMSRSDDEVWVNLSTSKLDKKAAYTVWWIVFNEPANCTGGCGLDDLAVAAVLPGAFYATGFVTGTDGIANISAHLKAGELPSGIDELLGTGQGLEEGNGLLAEIHLVIRSHGKLVTGAVGNQISTFDAECAVCEDQQAIAFLPL